MSASEEFDPYRKWLGIPADERPPNHYRLLGVGLFEDDADTIAGAADRQMGHVRTFQTGPHSAMSQKLLNELSAARLTLLDVKKKSAYDQQLRAKAAASSARTDEAGQGRGAAAGNAMPPAVAGIAPPRAAPSPTLIAAAVPAAGQGRGVLPQSAQSITIADESAASVRSSTTRLRRRRSRPEPALWAGVLLAVAVLAGVIYYAREQAKKEEQATSLAAQKPLPERRTETDRSSAEEKTTSKTSVNQTPDDASSNATDDETTEAPSDGISDAMPDKTAMEDPPARQVGNGNGVGQGTSTGRTSTDESPPEKRRSSGDLATISNRRQLARPHRETPPDGKAVIAANGRFAQLHGKEVTAAKTPDAVRTLTVRLFNQARQGADTADVHYVTFMNVGTLAANQGNLGFAYHVATEIVRQFDVDPFTVKLKALEAAGKNAGMPEAYAIGALQAAALSERAAAEGKLDVANKAAGQAGMLARKTKDKDLMAQIDRCKAALREQSPRNVAYLKALSDLKKSPDDSEANLAAGKYEVLVLGEWQGGLARLALASESLLAAVVQLEAEARADLGQWAPLATAWWQAALAEEDEFYKTQCQLQARYCYLRAKKLGRAGGVAPEISEQIKNVPGYPMSRLAPGAAARYYDGAAFEREKRQRADPAIDFFFGQNSPDPSVSTDFFSARWTGFFKPPVSGRYQIVTFTDNSVRLWVDGKEVLNRWGPGVAGWQQAELELTDEPHTFRFEFNDTIGAAIAMLGWTLADFPDPDHKQWSPIDALYYDPDSPFDLPELP